MLTTFDKILIGKLFHYADLLESGETRVKLGDDFAIRINDRKVTIEILPDGGDTEVFEWAPGDCPTCGGDHLCHSCGLPTWCPPDEPFEAYAFCNECDRLLALHEEGKLSTEKLAKVDPALVNWSLYKDKGGSDERKKKK